MAPSELAEAAFTVIDVETTGFSPVYDRVVEVACLRLERGAVVERFASLVDPRRPIPRVVSAIHGIRARHVRGAPLLEEIRPRIEAMVAGAIVVAHNARFDIGFLPFVASRPVLCTMRLAQRLVDAPNYRNRTLPRVLGLAIGPEGRHEHRAAADAYVTATVLHELLRRYARGPYPQTIAALLAIARRAVPLARYGMTRPVGY